MSLTDKLTDLLAPTSSPNQTAYVGPQRLGHQPPKGWEPGVQWNGSDGVAISKAMVFSGEEADHAALLLGWGFDPTTHYIDGPLEYREWDAAIGNGEVQKFRYYKAKIKQGVQIQYADLEALITEIKGFSLRRPRPRKTDSEDALCIFLSDFQVGKGENGGTKGTVERILESFDMVSKRVKELRSIGRPLGTLYVFGLGDLVEGCAEFYAQQTFTVDLNRRDQVKVVRRLIIAALAEWAPLFSRIVVVPVAGNHGENRREGKSFTDFADNDDVAVFEQVADALAQNPKSFHHVSFVFPRDTRLSTVVDAAGLNIGIVHGHQLRGGVNTQAKIEKWWKDQTFGMQPLADAQVLVSGHFHHFAACEFGKRTWFQVPAMDGGSEWFREGSGVESPTGILTFRATADGWTDLLVLR